MQVFLSWRQVWSLHSVSVPTVLTWWGELLLKQFYHPVRNLFSRYSVNIQWSWLWIHLLFLCACKFQYCAFDTETGSCCFFETAQILMRCLQLLLPHIIVTLWPFSWFNHCTAICFVFLQALSKTSSCQPSDWTESSFVGGNSKLSICSKSHSILTIYLFIDPLV